MTQQKDHGMTGKANASKGRKHWPKKTVQIDPDHLALIGSETLTDAIDNALARYLEKAEQGAARKRDS